MNKNYKDHEFFNFTIHKDFIDKAVSILIEWESGGNGEYPKYMQYDYLNSLSKRFRIPKPGTVLQDQITGEKVIVK